MVLVEGGGQSGLLHGVVMVLLQRFEDTALTLCG
jgi:hypothetical protein